MTGFSDDSAQEVGAPPPVNTFLVGEIGVSTVRLAFVAGTVDIGVCSLRKYRSYEFDSAFGAISAYLQEIGVVRVDAASLSVAGPVDGDQARLTNADWRIDARDLADALGARRVNLCNDFAAVAASLPHLGPANLDHVAGPALNGQEKARKRCMGVIGVSWGLGSAGLVIDGAQSTLIASEGGHASFAPQGELQGQVWKAIERRHGRVSYEKVLSDRGLQILHEAVQTVAGIQSARLSAAEITARAIEGRDWACVETAKLFTDILGAYAGDFALMLAATSGVYLCGESLIALAPILGKGGFRAAFEAKAPLQDYMSPIPTPLITHEAPGLIGLAAELRHQHGSASP